MSSLANFAQQSNDIVTNGMENTCYKICLPGMRKENLNNVQFT